MLPAISADLPAYLTPPSAREAGHHSTQNAGFGPHAEAALTQEQAVAASSRQPGNSLYGPDGRFIEAASGQDTSRFDDAARRADPTSDEDREAPDQPADETSAKSSASSRSDASNESSNEVKVDDIPSAPATEEGRRQPRELTLAAFDSAIPPAAREELRALADRFSRRTNSTELSAEEYRRLSRVYDRIGHYDKAHEALSRAESLEGGEEPERDAA